MSQPDTCNISARLARWADEKPDSPALIELSNRRQKTFRELDKDTQQVASGLIQCGMKPGDRVLLMTPYGLDFV
ncbi:MAG: AMP-binding protein, partial [Nitrospinota bacterium]